MMVGVLGVRDAIQFHKLQILLDLLRESFPAFAGKRFTPSKRGSGIDVMMY